MNTKLVPLKNIEHLNNEEMELKSRNFYETMKQRRTVRDFAKKDISRSIIDNCILTAGTAPSGANMQPWHFAISGYGDARKVIRQQAEKEEREFDKSKASAEWL